MGKAKKAKKRQKAKKPGKKRAAKKTTILIDYPWRVTNPESAHPMSDGKVCAGGSSVTRTKKDRLRSVWAVVTRKSAPVPTTRAAIKRLGGVKGVVDKAGVMWGATGVPGAKVNYDNQLVVLGRFLSGWVVQTRDFFAKTNQSFKASADPSLQLWEPMPNTDQYNCCELNDDPSGGKRLVRVSGMPENNAADDVLEKVCGLVVRKNATSAEKDLQNVQANGHCVDTNNYYGFELPDVPGAQTGGDNLLVVYGKFSITGWMADPVERAFYGCDE